MAVARVQDLISAVASRLNLEPDVAADRLGTPEIARRLGMALSLVEACLADAVTMIVREEHATGDLDR